MLHADRRLLFVGSPQMVIQRDEQELRLGEHQRANLSRSKPRKRVVNIDRARQESETDATTIEGTFYRRIGGDGKGIEDAITAPDNRFTVPNRIPGETNTRPKIVQVFLPSSGGSNIGSEIGVVFVGG